MGAPQARPAIFLVCAALFKIRVDGSLILTTNSFPERINEALPK